MTVKKAIILQYQTSTKRAGDTLLIENFNFSDNNFEIIDKIILDDQYCSKQLQKLIHLICNREAPVSLIINQGIMSSSSNIIPWSVIGTLLLAELIEDIWLFRKNWQVNYRNQINSAYSFKKIDINFLSVSLEHFKDLISYNRSLNDKNAFFT